MTIIKTSAEIDALPSRSAILDCHGDVGTILGSTVHYAETAPLSREYVAKHYLPATLLYRPDAAPAPVSDDAVEQAARVMFESTRESAASPSWDEAAEDERNLFREVARALAAAGLLASSPRTITAEQFEGAVRAWWPAYSAFIRENPEATTREDAVRATAEGMRAAFAAAGVEVSR